jgi:hypothetical protein
MLEKRENPKVGEYWKYYKGGVYRIIAVGKHSEDKTEQVVYKNAKGEVWIRPLAMFMGSLAEKGAYESLVRFFKVTKLEWDKAVSEVQKEEKRVKYVEDFTERLKSMLLKSNSFNVNEDFGIDERTRAYTGLETITIQINRG